MSRKAFRGLIAFILVVVLGVSAIVVCGIGSSVNGKWFENKNFQTWFNSWGQGSSDDDKEDDSKNNSPEVGENSGVVISPEVSEGNGVTLMSSAIPVDLYGDYGISPSIESAYTVTATVTPEDATYKDLTWSIAWGSEDLNWGSESKGEVNDYVSLIPDGNSAMVAFKKAFGTQILLTATVKGYDNVTGTATFDYVSRGSLADIEAEDYSAINLYFADGDSTGAVRYTLIPEQGIGSVMGTFSITSATVQFSNSVWFEHDSNFRSAYNYFNALKGEKSWGNVSELTFNQTSIRLNLDATSELTGKIGLNYGYFFACGGPGISGSASFADSSENAKQMFLSLKAYLIEVAQKLDITDWGAVTLSGTYSYGEYYSTDVSCTIGINGWNVSSLITPPSDVEMSDSSFYF